MVKNSRLNLENIFVEFSYWVLLHLRSKINFLLVQCQTIIANANCKNLNLGPKTVMRLPTLIVRFVYERLLQTKTTFSYAKIRN